MNVLLNYFCGIEKGTLLSNCLEDKISIETVSRINHGNECFGIPLQTVRNLFLCNWLLNGVLSIQGTSLYTSNYALISISSNGQYMQHLL